jgi:hypothetical protein
MIRKRNYQLATLFRNIFIVSFILLQFSIPPLVFAQSNAPLIQNSQAMASVLEALIGAYRSFLEILFVARPSGNQLTAAVVPIAQNFTITSEASDGVLANYQAGATWANVHDATTATGAVTTSAGRDVNVSSFAPTGNYEIRRAFFPFDTTALPTDEIGRAHV